MADSQDPPRSLVPAPEPEITPTVEVPRRGSRLTRAHLALGIAILADGLQIAAAPFFFEGAAAVWNDVLDVLVGVALVKLLGWHMAFLPSFVNKLIPFIDLFPTWTAAVLFVMAKGRNRGR